MILNIAIKIDHVGWIDLSDLGLHVCQIDSFCVQLLSFTNCFQYTRARYISSHLIGYFLNYLHSYLQSATLTTITTLIMYFSVAFS